MDLINLAITHGINVNSHYCKLKNNCELHNSFYEENKYRLKDENWKIIIAARMKIMLLSYTLRIPEYYGFETWSPFLDFKGVSKIINLDWKEKEGRKWQIEYFRRKNVLIGNLKLPCDYANSLDMIACLRHLPKPLDVKLMGTILDETYVEKINARLLNMSADNINYYNQYLVLYPIQKLLSLKER